MTRPRSPSQDVAEPGLTSNPASKVHTLKERGRCSSKCIHILRGACKKSRCVRLRPGPGICISPTPQQGREAPHFTLKMQEKGMRRMESEGHRPVLHSSVPHPPPRPPGPGALSGQVPVETCSPLKPEINSLSAGVEATSSCANQFSSSPSRDPGSRKGLGLQDGSQ